MKSPAREDLLAVIGNTNSIHEVASHYDVGWSTVRAWMRWLKVDLRPPNENLLALCGQFTDKEIGIKLKVSERTVSKWKDDAGISKNRMRAESFPKEFSQEQREILDGKLLGDGYCSSPRPDMRQHNSYFGADHSVKQHDYVNWLHDSLVPFSLPTRTRERKNPLATKPTHAHTLVTTCFRTKCHRLFTELRQKWYPNGVKVVPEDLKLTWLSLAAWYFDDGANLLGKRCIRRHAIIATNGFTIDNADVLMNKLAELDIYSKMYSQHGKPVIAIKKDSFMHMLNGIEPHVKWKGMEYKMKRNIEQAQ